jgi:hypothetical protein
MIRTQGSDLRSRRNGWRLDLSDRHSSLFPVPSHSIGELHGRLHSPAIAVRSGVPDLPKADELTAADWYFSMRIAPDDLDDSLLWLCLFHSMAWIRIRCPSHCYTMTFVTHFQSLQNIVNSLLNHSQTGQVSISLLIYHLTIN